MNTIKIKELYDIIIDGERNNTYEYHCIATYKDIRNLINTYTLNELKSLRSEITKWTSEQKATFALSLIHEDPNYEEIKEHIDVRDFYYDILLSVDDEDFQFVWEPWDFILEADEEVLKKLKVRIKLFQEKKPNRYVDGKFVSGYNYDAIYDSLDDAIEKASS